MRVVFELEAEQEMFEAADYYDAQVAGPGYNFLDEVEAGSNALGKDPFQYAFYDRPIRSIKLARFPYRLLFALEADRGFAVPVMHLHRRPGYWKRRRD